MFNVAVRELMDLTQASRYTADEAIKSANKTKKKPEKKELIKVQKLNKTGTEDH
jgi:single-stranded DNA-specific DHH superfamily exonuclease